MEYEIRNTDELYHWGIKGMRWGVRRYQNKDGSLTAAGKKRRAKLEGELKELNGVAKKGSGDSDGVVAPRKKSISEMSVSELKEATARMTAEKEYYNARKALAEANPKQVSKRQEFTEKFIKEAIVPNAIEAGKKLASNAMDGLVKKITGDKVDPNSLEALKKTYDKLEYKQKIDKMLNPDKYLSEEDKNKRQQRAFDAETREAQREGYQSVADRAKAKMNMTT